MSEIEKLITQLATKHEREVYNPNDHKTESNYNEVAAICADTAAAVIELIRERMPGDATKPIMVTEKMRHIGAGWNAYRSEIIKLLDNIK